MLWVFLLIILRLVERIERKTKGISGRNVEIRGKEGNENA